MSRPCHSYKVHNEREKKKRKKIHAGCLQCWSDVCQDPLDPQSIDGNLHKIAAAVINVQVQTVPAAQLGLATTLASGNQSQCCSTANESLSAFAEVSDEQCSTQSYVNGRPEDIAFLGSEEDILPPGTYIVPNVTFNCSGYLIELA